ncbi:holo-ACP synthase [Lachnospiraceae bacterium HCP1S3_C3]
MIVGIGCDIINIERIEKSINRNSFILNAYTEQEQEMSKGKAAFYADNFAVKEAVSKCFGTGFRGFGLTDIEVLRDGFGKPYVNLYGNAKELAKKLSIDNIYVTISNTDELSLAYAVAESGAAAAGRMEKL